MRKFILLISIPLLSFGQQQQFKITATTDVPICLLGMNFSITSALLKLDKDILSQADIDQLDSTKIPKIDRNAIRNYSVSAQKMSDYTATACLFLPLTVFSQESARKEWKEVALMTFEAYMLNAGITNLTKELVKRKRPFVYNKNVPMSAKMKRDANSSFFSGHTSMTATSTILTAALFNRYSPNDQFKTVGFAIGATIPLGVGYMRWKGGKHFFTDILTGYLVGTGIGLLVPALHQANQN